MTVACSDSATSAVEFVVAASSVTAALGDALLSLALLLPQPEGKPYTIVASRSHMSPETEQFIEEARKEHGQVETVSSGSSLKLCLVAEGTADAYPRFAPTMEWDTAAGHAVVACAGRWVYEAGTTTPLKYNKEDLHNPWFLVC